MAAIRKKNAKPKGNGDVYERDIFDKSTLCDENTLCAMCNGSREVAEEMSLQLASYGDAYDYITSDDECVEKNVNARLWVSKHGICTSQKRPVWVHYYCALFSPRTWLKRSQWHNVRSEVSRARSLQCQVCNKRGASMGCRVQRCLFTVHVPCALRIGWNPVIINQGTFHCPVHATELKRQLELEDAKFTCDISRGRETRPLHVAQSLLSKYPHITQFTYITSNIDHDSTHSEARDFRSLSRCHCINICTADCACAQVCIFNTFVRSVKIAQSESVDIVRECGMHCSCNLRLVTFMLYY